LTRPGALADGGPVRGVGAGPRLRVPHGAVRGEGVAQGLPLGLGALREERIGVSEARDTARERQLAVGHQGHGESLLRGDGPQGMYGGRAPDVHDGSEHGRRIGATRWNIVP
jgi:hypothetical protein